MNKTLLFALLFISLKGMGQTTKSDSIHLMKIGEILNGDTFGSNVTTVGALQAWGGSHQSDTARCIIFYCDTAWQSYGSRDSNLGVHAERNPLIYWMFGYVTWNFPKELPATVTRFPIIYLDKNKKPLPQSYIVISYQKLTQP